MIFFRYLEDWGYMSCIRSDVTKHLKDFGKDVHALYLRDKEPRAAQRVTDLLRAFKSRYLSQYEYEISASMPWNRMFKIALESNDRSNLKIRSKVKDLLRTHKESRLGSSGSLKKHTE